LINLATGNHTNHKNITYLQARNITITCDEMLESDLDGERGPYLPLTLSVIPNRVKVFMPL
jgi:diacylglycerol kinase (ATP)